MTKFQQVIREIAQAKAKKFGLDIDDVLPFYSDIELNNSHLLCVKHRPYLDANGHYVYKDVCYNPTHHKARMTVRTVWAGEEIDRKATKLKTKKRTEKQFYAEAIELLY